MEAFCVYRYNIPLLLRLYILPGTRPLAVQYPPQFTLFYLNSSPPQEEYPKEGGGRWEINSSRPSYYQAEA